MIEASHTVVQIYVKCVVILPMFYIYIDASYKDSDECVFFLFVDTSAVRNFFRRRYSFTTANFSNSAQ